ncbi:Ubiquitin family RING domain containing hypothetical protein [Phytophthora palmivora]|uniref:Ubiquitin-like domain-containing protein n=1 Tax=Phytophthora palmivora TaxID=4796 RepID=A0A2P4XCC1_9STRA|nr:Ubiquitin family RING domain containing hypothetical protein [Phytophthora palmivora]
MVMPTTTLSVLWKDSNRRGLRGVVEIPISALSFENARISDLIEEFNHRTQGICREVESILLYGTRLSTERRLQAIIPDLKGSSPRLIATMQVPSADTFDKVVVTETLTDKRTLIPYMPRETVASFKNQLQDIEGIPASEQILAFNNTRLEDQRTLQSYNIKARSKIYLVWTLNGGYIPSRGILGSHYTSVLAKHDPVNAPRWRVAYEGLNIEGICKNRLCAAFRQMIIYPYQFESFNLVLEGCIQCPSCHLSVKPVTCGFYNCTWKFEGIRSHDEVSVSSAWKKASGNADNLRSMEKPSDFDQTKASFDSNQPGSRS